MLRILRDDLTAHRVTLALQGHIAGAWAGVLEHECMELSRSGHEVVLDLGGVAFISCSGVEVIGRLSGAGVGIVGCLPLIAEVLEQEGIEAGRAIGDAHDRSVPGKREGPPTG